MRTSQYKELMEALDSAVNNGYEEELFAMSAEEVFNDILDLTGTRTFEDVSRDEIIRAIEGWKQKWEEEGYA